MEKKNAYFWYRFGWFSCAQQHFACFGLNATLSLSPD